MDNQFKLLPNDVRDRAEVYRNGIVESLIVIDKYPSWAIAEAQAGKMVQNFTELAKVGKSGSRSEWASFKMLRPPCYLELVPYFRLTKATIFFATALGHVCGWARKRSGLTR